MSIIYDDMLTKYEGNPVLEQITAGNRDPKVFWYEPSKEWVMVLYVELKGVHTIHFFTSPNLKEWTLASVLEGDKVGQGGYLYECPDFFELAVDGDPSHKKWVLTAANSEYAVGTFDGTTFHPEATKLRSLFGRGFYAAQTFSDMPSADGRRVQIGWFQTTTPGMSFNQSMTLPLELKLVSTPEGARLSYTPIRELSTLRRRSLVWNKNDFTLIKEMGTLRNLSMVWKQNDFEPEIHCAAIEKELSAQKTAAFEVRTLWKPSADAKVSLLLRGIPISYDVQKQELHVENMSVKAPLSAEGLLDLTLYCDRTGLELFANKGVIYIPLPVNIQPDNTLFHLSYEKGTCQIQKMEFHILKSIWE